MKKVLALVLALALTLGMSATAFAMQLTITDGTNNVNIEIEPSDSVEELKSKISDRSVFGYPAISRQTLSYNGTVWADNQIIATYNINGNETINLTLAPGGNTDVKARKVDNTISASVSWGSMEFTYDVLSTTWSCTENANRIIVTNNSPSRVFYPTYQYTGESALFTDAPKLFTSSIDSFVVGTTSDTGTGITTSAQYIDNSGLAAGGSGSETSYLMFTTNTTTDELDTDFAKVGTLLVSVIPVD